MVVSKLLSSIRLSTLALCIVILAPAARAAAATCVPSGYGTLTAALVNPGVVTGTVDATGCDIGVYFNSGTGKVDGAAIFGARWFGVAVNGDVNKVTVDIVDSHIFNIGSVPFDGGQWGVAVYYRAYFVNGGSTSGRIAGNTIEQYQKAGIVTNGPRTNVQIRDNIVTGLGPVAFIAQNGIQVGYGATAVVMRNTVSNHSYTGYSTVAGGITIVGGAGYGGCPDGNPCRYTANTQIVQNTVTNNDIGIFLTNYAADFSAPATATNIKAVNNVVSNDSFTNGYYGVGYQAGISDVGNNDKIIANQISGSGYDPVLNPFAWAFFIDADQSFTNRPKVHANR